MVLIRLLTLRTLVHMQTISKNVRAGRTCNLSVHYFPASSPGPRGRAGDPLQRAAASLCSRDATCVPSAASCPRFAIRQRRDPTPTQASTRSQPKKKKICTEILLLPGAAAAMAGAARIPGIQFACGRAAGRRPWEASLCSCPCARHSLRRLRWKI